MNIGEVARDAARLVRERPVIVIGAGVAGLFALRFLTPGEIGQGEAAAEGEAAPVDTGVGSGTFGLGYGEGLGGTGLYASGGAIDYGYLGDLPGPTTLPITPSPPLPAAPTPTIPTNTTPRTGFPSTPTPTPTPTPAPPTIRPPSHPRPSDAVGYIVATGVLMHARWGTWSTYPGPVSSLRSPGFTGSRWVSGERAVYLGSDPTKRRFTVRRVANGSGGWTDWFVPITVQVR